jgi:hypothetical protein
MLDLLINYAGLLLTAFTTCTYTSEITAIIKPLLSPIYYTTVTVFKGIKGIYTYFTSWDGGSVDPSTPTPQTEVKEGNTDNSQGVNNRPNTSLSPLVQLVNIPSNTGTNTI